MQHNNHNNSGLENSLNSTGVSGNQAHNHGEFANVAPQPPIAVAGGNHAFPGATGGHNQSNTGLENNLNNTGLSHGQAGVGNQGFTAGGNQGYDSAATAGGLGGVSQQHGRHGHAGQHDSSNPLHHQHPASHTPGTGSSSSDCACIPGAPDCTHNNGRSRGNVAGACGCAPGSSSCTHNTGAHHGSHTATGAKPSIGDKIAGTVQETVGKVTKDPAKQTEGAILKTEGKAALHAGQQSANSAVPGAASAL